MNPDDSGSINEDCVTTITQLGAVVWQIANQALNTIPEDAPEQYGVGLAIMPVIAAALDDERFGRWLLKIYTTPQERGKVLNLKAVTDEIRRNIPVPEWFR